MRMVEEERYCIDIVTQIAAVRAALRRVEEECFATTSRIASNTRSSAEMPLISAARLKKLWTF